ncbi:galactoside alpha-(1,2)-fucosyltransferase 2-like isoform X2 [Gigantopelta aegis]|nr:galactoside alpha-(1,2)-fucosyltransferase 2-like isoform X2 [Gigantopelta aegis]XP_041376354.1 galactoside alpha-(1,2)-fucosyltransferase 2-like isoform X2 [Gigantopelta aegis]XP_041376355.1 galactoside alpha-(1,2)-fucosyltransferase 2-like isoform X2 [Gigantopelta aegis]
MRKETQMRCLFKLTAYLAVCYVVFSIISTLSPWSLTSRQVEVERGRPVVGHLQVIRGSPRGRDRLRPAKHNFSAIHSLLVTNDKHSSPGRTDVLNMRDNVEEKNMHSKTTTSEKKSNISVNNSKSSISNNDQQSSISKSSTSTNSSEHSIPTNSLKSSISTNNLKSSVSTNITELNIVKKIPTHSISINFIGRLGNLMFQYASLYGIARKNSLRPLIPSQLIIDKLFHLDAYRVSSGYGRHSGDRKYAEQKGCTFERQALELGPDRDVFLSGYFQSWKYFKDVERDVRKQFTFNDALRAAADDQVKRLTDNADRSGFVLVGVHVRRGDMVQNKGFVDYGYIAADELYLNKAMDYFEGRYPNLKFLVVSDDIGWCKQVLDKRDNHQNVLYGPADNAPEVDMALLTRCNHTVMTVGSFGWWSAWLAGGDVIYYKGYPRPKSRLFRLLKPEDYRYPHWIGM